jgi:sugar phosphate permease
MHIYAPAGLQWSILCLMPVPRHSVFAHFADFLRQMMKPPSHTRYRVLWLLFALAVITYLDRLCISAAAPVMSEQLQLSTKQMSYVFSAFTLAYALFEVPSGWLGDRFGTRKALVRIVVCWSLFTLLTGAVTGLMSLLIVRFLFGAGEAGAFPNIARTVSRWLPPAEHGRGISVSFLGLAIGSAISAPLVFQLIDQTGWRWAFVITAIPGFIWCLVWHFWFCDEPKDHPAVNQHELAIINTGRDAESAAHRIAWLTFLRNPNLWFICGMYFAYGYGIYFYINWLPTYLLKARGFNPSYTQLFSSLPWLISAGAFWVGGWLTDTLAKRNLRLARCGIGSLGYTLSALLLIAIALTPNKYLAAAFITLASCFQMMTVSAAWSVCLDVGKKQAGVVTGFMNMIGNLGGAISPLVVGWSVQDWQSWTIPFYITAGIFAFGVLMWSQVRPERPLKMENELIVEN